MTTMTTMAAGALTDSKQQQQQQHYMVGVTQPRRVAAVSTAKRVCFEMGQGNGQVIPNNNNYNNMDGNAKGSQKSGNLVAYQTRYETAGLDANATTHIKFMTDGILLQEIQSDLLLRKYSVIVLDEAHERNLNTDVLIGLLLSATLPLRRKAALEEEAGGELGKSKSTLVPLKLVIMSATLRVQDFTDNAKLFAAIPTPPAVVRIPGRTFPVTIHHAKVTELDQYQDVALKKICKIHRRLPAGGILVFLTGKQEILTMVRKLRRILDKTKKRSNNCVGNESTSTLLSMTADVQPVNDVHDDSNALRDMDDDEIDGDIFRDENDDDDEVDSENVVNDSITETKKENNDKTDTASDEGPTLPDKVWVLPLYSLMAPEEQAKVFAPVPDGHRLIVVATNIAETVRKMFCFITATTTYFMYEPDMFASRSRHLF
jgi:ATP-dependent RNA helicase DHX37/DHR1